MRRSDESASKVLGMRRFEHVRWLMPRYTSQRARLRMRVNLTTVQKTLTCIDTSRCTI